MTLVRLGGSAVDPRCLEQGLLLDDTGRVQRVRLEEAPQSNRVPPAIDLLGIARDQVVDVALQPVAPRAVAQTQGCLGEAAA
jgi:hypothetical protein